MRKLLVPLICLLCGSIVSLHAQTTRLEARDAEWTGYAIPQTNFVRQVTPDKTLVFRVPAGWKQEGTELIFNGLHGSQISITSQTVPDGYALTEYVAAVLRQLAEATSSNESILTRRIQIQDLEGREVYVESPDVEGKMFRSTMWITISGPLAVNVAAVIPMEHVTAVEPFLKAIVQSVMFVPANFEDFENARNAAIKTPAAGPINELQNIAAGLNQLNTDREAAINRLTPLFVSHADAAVDLLLDRRAAVRAAAVEALARSRNPVLKPFLWHVLDDYDPFVAEAAARRVGQETDVVAQLLNRIWTRHVTVKVARVWPFMTKQNRIKYLEGLFSQTTPERNAEIVALTLLGDTVTPNEFKLPLARILAAKYDPLTKVALQVANNRGDQLPVESLLKLAASPNEEIKKLAIESLGQSASLRDIPQLDALRPKTPASTAAANDKEAAARKAIDEAITVSIKKIRLRADLRAAKNEQWREIILKASSDNTIDDFAWRFDCELDVRGCSPATATRNLPPDFKVKSFAENLFPQRVSHFTAIPNPAQTVQRFYETLHGLQLDSPRAQANLLLVMGTFRENIGQQLGAPPDAPVLIDYAGIKSDSPIVLGAWTAAGAPDSVDSAQRKAIVLRVKDRERFERVVEKFQRTSGNFMYLTHILALGARAAAALPALLPFSAQAIVAADPDKPHSRPLTSYSMVGQTEWNGIPVKSIQHRWINADWTIEGADTYLAFIGDAAILTQDLATIRDLLSNATAAEQQLLAGNEEFRRVTSGEGDIVYFSDLKAVMADPADKSLEETKKANESGALKFSSSSWENSHRMIFDESEWSKPLLPFHPKDLSAPRDLLPPSTLAYLLFKIDVAKALETWPKTMNLREDRFEIDPSLWSVDFKQEVVPELGPECGAVLLEPPDFKEHEGGTWAGFCKLKTNKLADAFAAGKLFRGVGPTTDSAEIKRSEGSYFAAIKNGFLVVSNKRNGLTSMHGKTNLASARDYSRAAEKVPSGIIAFGGYNLEAAIAAAGSNATDGLRAQMAGMALSVASAFHSQSFFATAGPGTIEGRSSVAMDREGRYAVADLSYLPRGANITYATLHPHGLPIINQRRLSNLVLRVRAKAPGPIESIKDDIKLAGQTVEQKSPNELIVNIAARRIASEKKMQLPITNAQVAEFLKPTGEITSDDQNVIAKAREIAGEDRDAWSVARKLADWTYKNLEWKVVARAGAAETLASREADCSEFSQLYVAMARSLGLPARIVSGLAYSGNSFAGHAWVEVWIGEWIELDPTWGTDFVDATHIRNQASALLTAAALNLIDVEVLETPRTVAEFQKSPKALAEHLVKAIGAADKAEVEAALDPAILTDEFMGRGAWNGLNEHERDQISAAYRRVLNELIVSYGYEGELFNNFHLLHVDEKDDRAEALCYDSHDDLLLRLRLARRDNVWYLVETVAPDNGYHMAAEIFAPVIKSIEAVRAGKRPTARANSDFSAVLAVIDDEPAKAIEIIDRMLQAKPNAPDIRFLKAIALSNLEKEDEANKLFAELSNEQHAAATYRLATHLYETKPEEAIELYKRYSSLEPYDLRGYRDLAVMYEKTKQPALAEAAYRKAIAVDPFEIPGYIDLISFLILNDRVAEVGPVFRESDKYATPETDIMTTVLSDLEDDIKLEDAERLVAAEAHRFKTSVWATLALSDIYVREKRYATALEVIGRAAQIDPKLPYPHIAMASVHKKQARLVDALKAVNHAVSLDEKNSNAHYVRATVLARMGRKKDAMSALEKSIELNSHLKQWVAEDEDFKLLRSLPAFKKLVSDAEKEAEAASDPK